MCYKTNAIVPKLGIEPLQLHIKFLKKQYKNQYTQTRMTLQSSDHVLNMIFTKKLITQFMA